MTYTRKNQGVCSRSTTVQLSEAGIIQHIEVSDGCEGNLSGVCALLAGLSAKKAIQKLRGIRCENKPTSCPDQIALCLAEALEKQKN